MVLELLVDSFIIHARALLGEKMKTSKKKTSGGSSGLVVKGGDAQSEGCEFEFRHWILKGHFSH